MEITKEHELTPRGDCILAVRSEKSARDLSEEFKKLARDRRAVITLEVRSGDLVFVLRGSGDPRLSFDDPTSLVFRKSAYVDRRTVAVRCDKAAADVPRELVSRLKRREEVLITLSGEVPDD